MGQVTVRFCKKTPLKGNIKGNITTHYNMTLKQADREGVIVLNDDGKIVKVLQEGADIQLPESLRPEDIFALTPAKKIGHTPQDFRSFEGQ